MRIIHGISAPSKSQLHFHEKISISRFSEICVSQHMQDIELPSRFQPLSTKLCSSCSMYICDGSRSTLYHKVISPDYMMLTESETYNLIVFSYFEPSVLVMARCMCSMPNISGMPDRKHLVGGSSYNRIFLGEVHGRDTTMVSGVQRPSVQKAQQQFVIPATFCPADTYFVRPHYQR